MEVVTNEFMYVFNNDGTFVRRIPHLKHCNEFMKEKAAYPPKYRSDYFLTDSEGLKLARVNERHPQWFECRKCGKTLIRRYYCIQPYVAFYINEVGTKYFTAIADSPNKHITWEKYTEIVFDNWLNNER